LFKWPSNISKNDKIMLCKNISDSDKAALLKNLASSTKIIRRSKHCADRNSILEQYHDLQNLISA
jgi:hypothetical protein